MQKVQRIGLAAASVVLVAAAIAIPISLQPTAYSRGDLNAVTSRINTDAATWKSQGILLSSWGPDSTLHVVVVHLAHYTEAAARKIAARYGSIVQVSHESQSSSGS